MYGLKVRGVVRIHLGDFTGALKDLNKADQLSEEDSFTLSYRGKVKSMLGDLTGALNLNQMTYLRGEKENRE